MKELFYLIIGAIFSVIILLTVVVKENFFVHLSPPVAVATAERRQDRDSVLSRADSPVIFQNENIKPLNASEYVMVQRIIDGDTIELETGEKVRYIGIDTPETVSPKKSVQCFGEEASVYNRQLTTGQLVRLEKDVSETDKYGRLLRYVYLPDGTFINLLLVKEGYASADTFPPDVKYSKLFVDAAKNAREEGKGLWGKCNHY